MITNDYHHNDKYVSSYRYALQNANVCVKFQNLQIKEKLNSNRGFHEGNKSFIENIFLTRFFLLNIYHFREKKIST